MTKGSCLYIKTIYLASEYLEGGFSAVAHKES